MMTRSLRLLDIHGSRKSWKKVFRNCLNTEPGSGDCTGEDILFLSGVVLQSQVEHYGITALKKWLPYVHFYDTDFFSPRSIWGIFLKTFLTESDYEVDWKGRRPESFSPASPALTPWHVTECPGRGNADGPKGHTATEDLRIMHSLAEVC